LQLLVALVCTHDLGHCYVHVFGAGVSGVGVRLLSAWLWASSRLYIMDPVVFSAELRFAMHGPPRRLAHSVRPSAAHKQPSTQSARLTSRVSEFLARTSLLTSGRRSTAPWRSQMTELSVALAEEQSAASLAAERLETEASERARLQHELQNAQVSSPRIFLTGSCESLA
jgi:hypothetical protein